MKAIDLLGDPEFLAFLKCWEADGRCPIGLGDWLRERGLEGEGAGAEWAALQPDRTGYAGSERLDGGVRPYWVRDERVYSWCRMDRTHSPVRSAIPVVILDYFPPATRTNYGTAHFPTFPDAVVWFLSAWAVVLSSEVTT